MRDFLKGTMGVFVQVVLVVLGIVLIGVSCVVGAAGSAVGSIVSLVLGILCFCAAAGIRYWLGHIVRMR